MAEIVYRELKEITLLEDNPRKISEEQMEKLKTSIESNKDYFECRPVILSDRTGELVVIAGNQRVKAATSLGWKEVPTILLSGLSEEREKEIIIRDNVNNGEWDEELLAEWDAALLDDWGVDVSAMYDENNSQVREESATSKLSTLEYKGVYYEPKNIPNLELVDCVNMDKFNKKLEVIECSELTAEQKDLMKVFAYRFIKIDFEAVANYYTYNATDEEKKVIERLRLVLVDDGVNGFIGDDMVRIMENDLASREL